MKYRIPRKLKKWLKKSLHLNKKRKTLVMKTVSLPKCNYVHNKVQPYALRWTISPQDEYDFEHDYRIQ